MIAGFALGGNKNLVKKVVGFSRHAEMNSVWSQMTSADLANAAFYNVLNPKKKYFVQDETSNNLPL